MWRALISLTKKKKEKKYTRNSNPNSSFVLRTNFFLSSRKVARAAYSGLARSRTLAADAKLRYFPYFFSLSRARVNRASTRMCRINFLHTCERASLRSSLRFSKLQSERAATLTRKTSASRPRAIPLVCNNMVLWPREGVTQK